MDKKWVLAERAKIREELFGGLLKVPIESAKIHGQSFYILTPVEYRILQLCSTPVTAEEISERICEEFDAAYEDVAVDVAEYLQKLSQLLAVNSPEEHCHDDCTR